MTNYYHNTTTFLIRPVSFINVLVNTILLYIFPYSPLPQECRLSILPTRSIPPLAVIKLIYSGAIPKPLQDIIPFAEEYQPQISLEYGQDYVGSTCESFKRELDTCNLMPTWINFFMNQDCYRQMTS
jgi:hypothetical protein